MKIDLQEHWGNKELFQVPVLVSKIVKGMQEHGQVYLWTKEGKSGVNNGFFKLLDELCDFWGWNKSAITFAHPQTAIEKLQLDYNLEILDYSMSAVDFIPRGKILPWNKEKTYGMFIGRADCSRIRAIHNHKNFKYKNLGLTSFHCDLFEYMSKPDLVEYFMESGQTYQEMVSIKPYSDIDKILPVPITPAADTEVCWNQVYERIGIEIVCETSIEPDSFDITEKFFRPMYYKRPILLIASPGTLQFVKSLGYEIFEDFIPSSYDELCGIRRVDQVFQILKELIANDQIEEILEKSTDMLDYNHNLFLQQRKKWAKFNLKRFKVE